MYIAGFDIGGTKTAAVIAEKTDEDIKFIIRKEIPTTEDWKSIIGELISWISSECKRLGITLSAAGISCGGPLSPDRKLILSPPNLPGWDSVPIVRYISDKLGINTYMENDADACAVAEYLYGAGKGSRNMIFLTFGTGLGAGLILDRRLYRGSCGMAGEVGHIRMSESGPIGYKKAGSLEGYASGGGIKQLSGGKSAREVIMAARSGDSDSIHILEQSAQYLGRGISILTDILNPDRIIIGSLFVRAEKFMRGPLEKELKKEALEDNEKAVEIFPAKLGEKIGDYGAVCAALYNIYKNV